jgi:hypothetical protein
MSICWASAGGLALAAAPAQAPAPSQAAGEATTFEAAARNAEDVPDLAALVSSLSGDCARARREIDRARCRGMQSFLGSKLPHRLFSAVVDSSRVVTVSAYDASVKGYRMKVVGCLTCEEAVNDPALGKRFLTLKVPAKDGETLAAAAALARPNVTFPSVEDARAWEAGVKPHLRAQFVFRPTAKEWSYKQHRGLAFEPVAMRVFNRCTGEIVYSEPPSQERSMAVAEGLAGCDTEESAPPAVAASGGGKRKQEGLAELPEKLGALEIGQALRSARAEMGACDSQFKTRGSVDLEFEVPGSGGTAQAVRAKGNLGGTDVAQCLMQAARKVQFPRFQGERQTFKYSVHLQGN